MISSFEITPSLSGSHLTDIDVDVAERKDGSGIVHRYIDTGGPRQLVPQGRVIFHELVLGNHADTAEAHVGAREVGRLRFCAKLTSHRREKYKKSPHEASFTQL
jgi:hypothetical protein